MPAVLIRQLDAVSKIVEHTITEQQRALEQAVLIFEATEQSVPQAFDRADVKRASDAVRRRHQFNYRTRRCRGLRPRITSVRPARRGVVCSRAAGTKRHQSRRCPAPASAASARATSVPRPSLPRPTSETSQSSEAT